MSCSFECLCFIVGLVFLIEKTVNLILSLYHIFKQKCDSKTLQTKFGSGSYVLITGSSSGIGKAYALWFAEQGFNLILWSRNESRLNSVRDQILEKYPKVDIKIVAKDFSDSTRDDFFTSEFAALEELDISILVNNVGIMYASRTQLGDHLIEEIVKSSNVNMIPQAVLTQLCLERFVRRDPKYSNAIVDLSSSAAVNVLPFAKIYGASKAFNNYFSEGFGYFYSKIGNVQQISVMPSPVRTALGSSAVKLFNAQIPLFSLVEKLMITETRDCVAGSMKCLLGGMTRTGGSINHCLLLWVFDLGSNFALMLNDLFGYFRKIRKYVNSK